MSVTGIVPTSSASTSDTETKSGGGIQSMTQEDFLKIIVAELTNQNPLGSESGESTSSSLLQNFMSLQNIQAMQDMTTSVDTQTANDLGSFANDLVGAYVTVASDDAETKTTGYVSKSRVVDGAVLITVDGTEYNVANLVDIQTPPVVESATTP